MGISSSSQNVPKGKALVASKLSIAEKTGSLNLSDSDIKATSKTWGNLPVQKLKTLDMSGNNVKTLPPEIAQMAQLKILHASRCHLNRVFDINTLPKLTTLNLSINELNETSLVPMGLPPQLRSLNLSENHFTMIPDSCLAGVLNLTELNLSFNQLESIHGLGVLVSLIELKLDNNNITEISADLSLCQKLKHISVSNNKISGKNSIGEQSIPSGIFIDTQLDELILNGNSMLSKKMIYDFEGIDIFIERRRKSKDRNIIGGAAADDLDIFGGLE